MKRALKAVNTIVKAILILLVALFLIYDVSAVIQKYALKRDIPQFFGYAAAAVVSDSMYPNICKGDLVIVDVDASYTAGDVVMYYDYTSDIYITHRVVEMYDDGSCMTWGDNSDSPDTITVTQDMVYGKVVAVLGGVGTVVSFLQQPTSIILVILIAALIIAIMYVLSKFFSSGKSDGKD